MASLKVVGANPRNTDFSEKYRPFLTIFLRKSVLQTKNIFTDQIVITGIISLKQKAKYKRVIDRQAVNLVEGQEI